MSDFRESQNKAHPNKTNTLMVGIIVLLICILSMQIWLLYTALNNALDNNFTVALSTFIGSGLLFLVSASLLRYLPTPRSEKDRRRK